MRLDLFYRKAKGVPANIDRPAQDAFRDGPLKPLLNQAVAGKGHVSFVDAAHFVRSAFLGYLWCVVAFVVATAAGRQRYSVMGGGDRFAPFLHQSITFAETDTAEVACFKALAAGQK